MKQVVCAMIVNDGKLLIAQHGMHSGHPFQWEFPGGKIIPGEKAEVALKREVYEELLIEISVEIPLQPVIYQYPGREIYLMPFICNWISGEIQLMEHYDFRWINVRDIFDFDMLPADFEMLNRGDNFIRLLHYSRSFSVEGSKLPTSSHNLG